MLFDCSNSKNLFSSYLYEYAVQNKNVCRIYAIRDSREVELVLLGIHAHTCLLYYAATIELENTAPKVRRYV